MRLIDADILHYKKVWIENEDYNVKAAVVVFAKEIDKAHTIDEIYGYPVKDLLMFALSCRQQGITEGELHDFVLNVQTAYDVVNKEFENIVKDCVGRMMNNDH